MFGCHDNRHTWWTVHKNVQVNGHGYIWTRRLLRNYNCNADTTQRKQIKAAMSTMSTMMVHICVALGTLTVLDLAQSQVKYLGGLFFRESWLVEFDKKLS